MKNTIAVIVGTASLTEKKNLNLEKSILTVLSSSMAQIKNLQASGSGVFHFSTLLRWNSYTGLP